MAGGMGCHLESHHLPTITTHHTSSLMNWYPQRNLVENQSFRGTSFQPTNLELLRRHQVLGRSDSFRRFGFLSPRRFSAPEDFSEIPSLGGDPCPLEKSIYSEFTPYIGHDNRFPTHYTLGEPLNKPSKSGDNSCHLDQIPSKTDGPMEFLLVVKY